MKICGTCKKERPLSEFSLRYGKPQFNCKECHSAYRKEHYGRNRQKYIDKATRNKDVYARQYYEWLSKQFCADCGISDIRVLEQDHLGDKESNISTLVGRVRLSTMMKELEKCETVCANCHRIRTITRGGWIKQEYCVGTDLEHKYATLT
jgi:hypothetical protein